MTEPGLSTVWLFFKCPSCHFFATPETALFDPVPLMFLDFFKPKPFNSGYLPTENGHQVFFHEFGNKNGQPVLCFHGGPGGNSHAGQAQSFNLKTHRIILFDQRGGGQSLPRGETRHNTTNDLLHDAERLLAHVHIDQFCVYGSSWGATLALLMAQRHPDRVQKIILARTFLSRKQDADWLFNQTRIFYPDMMQKVEAPVPAGESARHYYAQLVASGREADRVQSAKLFGRYEYVIGSVDPHLSEDEPTPNDIAYHTIYMHYDSHDYFVGDNEILDNMHMIHHIPALIVHNRLDMICPFDQAWQVHQAYRGTHNSRLVAVPDHGHGSPLFKTVLKKEIAAFLKQG